MGWNRYSPSPEGPYEHEEAVLRLTSKYRLSPHHAGDLVTRALNSTTGMASYPENPPPGRSATWVTHMSTLSKDGVNRYIIERGD